MHPEPLSLRYRRVALFGLVLLWIILVPIVILYADGWRYKSGFGFVRTGGIFVWAPYTDAHISLDGKSVGSSSFLDRGLYISNLAPSSYTVTVEKPGYRPWKKVVVVEPLVVTDVQALLVNSDIEITKLSVKAAATSSAHVSEDTLEAYRAVFSARQVASSTMPIGESKAIRLFIDEGRLVARWNGSGLPPSILCGRPSYCVEELMINASGRVTRAMLYHDGVIYRTDDGRIVFTEIDVRPEPLLVELYFAPRADVALIDGALVIKDGAAFYSVEEF